MFAKNPDTPVTLDSQVKCRLRYQAVVDARLEHLKNDVRK